MAPAVNDRAVWTLGALLRPWLDECAGADTEVADVVADSRTVSAGSVFLAVAGGRHHGLDFAGRAVEAGAAAILWDEAPEPLTRKADDACARSRVACLHVPGLRSLAGEIAGRFHGEPSRGLPVVGVTGTDGKTSVSQFLAQALTAGGTACGVVGTLGHGIAGRLKAGTHTTPDAAELQRQLAELRAAGAGAIAMEVSSHALDQYRVGGVRFDCAVLTNLSRDHLDYHGTDAAYADAKARLFHVAGLGTAVLNADDDFGRRLEQEIPARVRRLRYSLDPASSAELVAEAIAQRPGGLGIRARIMGEALRLEVPLLGRFNVANILATAGALLALGRAVSELPGLLGDLAAVPGRMERFSAPGRADIIVDYAHTPAALEAALAAVRAHYPGSIWCVFGCGGDRDRGKRPLMGAAAARGADHVIITDDNPRTEDPDAIVEEIRAGAVASASVGVERDRPAAIAAALAAAAPGDAVLVAGKGHEDYQVVGRDRAHYSDRETVRALMEGGH